MLSTQPAEAEAAPFQELKRLLTASLHLSMQLGDSRGSPWEAHARRLRKFIEFVEQEHAASIDGCIVATGESYFSKVVAEFTPCSE